MSCFWGRAASGFACLAWLGVRVILAGWVCVPPLGEMARSMVAGVSPISTRKRKKAEITIDTFRNLWYTKREMKHRTVIE